MSSRIVDLGDGTKLRAVPKTISGWLLECPCGCYEQLDERQLRGELSVNHAASGRFPNCTYHETRDFQAAIDEPVPMPVPDEKEESDE